MINDQCFKQNDPLATDLLFSVQLATKGEIISKSGAFLIHSWFSNTQCRHLILFNSCIIVGTVPDANIEINKIIYLAVKVRPKIKMSIKTPNIKRSSETSFLYLNIYMNAIFCQVKKSNLYITFRAYIYELTQTFSYVIMKS